MCVCVWYVCLLKQPGSNNNPVAMNTHSTFTLVSKQCSILKENRSFGKLAGAKVGAEKIQNVLRISFVQKELVPSAPKMRTYQNTKTII